MSEIAGIQGKQKSSYLENDTYKLTKVSHCLFHPKTYPYMLNQYFYQSLDFLLFQNSDKTS